jgi:hypothetical protein
MQISKHETKHKLLPLPPREPFDYATVSREIATELQQCAARISKKVLPHLERVITEELVVVAIECSLEELTELGAERATGSNSVIFPTGPASAFGRGSETRIPGLWCFDSRQGALPGQAAVRRVAEIRRQRCRPGSPKPLGTPSDRVLDLVAV